MALFKVVLARDEGGLKILFGQYARAAGKTAVRKSATSAMRAMIAEDASING